MINANDEERANEKRTFKKTQRIRQKTETLYDFQELKKNLPVNCKAKNLYTLKMDLQNMM